MELRHTDPEIARLESDPDYRGTIHRDLVSRVRRVLNLIRSVSHEAELGRFAGLRFKKLHGDRAHEYSMRINDQWRLIVEIEKGDAGNRVVVKGIEDYH